ncbi:MAG: chromate transporter [Clostridiales bacterium]|nr:chromate transporter [Candidatus Crickella caballi]
MWELIVVFLKLGIFTIGGGIAMVPILQDVLIREKKWYTEQEFVDMIAICQSLPGVVAINMATYVGYKRKGFLGSVVSTLAIVLPSWLIIILICKGMAVLSDNTYLNGALAGFRAAAVGLIIAAVISLGKMIITNAWSVAAAISAFVLIVFLHVDTAIVILIFLALGVLSAAVNRKNLAKAADEEGGDR